MEQIISLDKSNNYNKLIKDQNKCLLSFIKTINITLKYINDNSKVKINKKYIILRGLETFINVYKIVLLYTKNIKLIEEHCKRSVFYYVEFVGQIKLDTNLYLQLNSKDATIFVYKKTIFKLENKYSTELSADEKQFFSTLNLLIEFYTLIFKHCIKSEDYSTDIFFKYINLLEGIIKKKRIDILKNLYEFVKLIRHLDINKIMKFSKKFINKNKKLINKNFKTKILNFIQTTQINKFIEQEKINLLINHLFVDYKKLNPSTRKA